MTATVVPSVIGAAGGAIEMPAPAWAAHSRMPARARSHTVAPVPRSVATRVWWYPAGSASAKVAPTSMYVNGAVRCRARKCERYSASGFRSVNT